MDGYRRKERGRDRGRGRAALLNIEFAAAAVEKRVKLDYQMLS